jgi:hypothetical protein
MKLMITLVSILIVNSYTKQPFCLYSHQGRQGRRKAEYARVSENNGLLNKLGINPIKGEFFSLD